MSLSFYNTLTAQKEVFKPLEDNTVKIYSCGPTVYDFAHIGNLRAYAFVDVLRRYLKYSGYDVYHVMNITDVEDKIIKKAKEGNVKYSEVSLKYEKEFFEDLKTLGIQEVEKYPRATEHINEMVNIIKGLMDKGYAYKGQDGSIYFKIENFSDYGKLSKINKEELVSGIRVDQDEYSKDKACDFALWKAYTPEDADVFWETELGKGRPGWHIECSAMSTKYLGETLDIHTGGVDLIFPHHENEIAQTESLTSKPFVKYWLHNEHLLVDDKKMSKSLGNFYTLRDLKKKGLEPQVLRYFYVSNHYRSKINFTMPVFNACRNTLENLNEFISRISGVKKEGNLSDGVSKLIEVLKNEFKTFMDDDLNTPRALSAVFNFIKEINKIESADGLTKGDSEKILETLYKINEVFGFDLTAKKEDALSDEEKKLIEEREQAREKKDWKRSDEIRDILKQKGILIEDQKGAEPRIVIKRQIS